MDVTLREADIDDLPHFGEMERDAEASRYVTVESQQKHRQEFERETIRYLAIEHERDCAGFIILALEPGTGSVEFRRIVVAARGLGIGGKAISALEHYCRNSIGCQRIWLDVFTSNKRAHHLYTKLGYREFKRGDYNGRELIFMDKSLADDPDD